MDDGPRVLPFIGVIARPGTTPDEVAAACARRLFLCAGRSASIAFDFTDYYRAEMGEALTRYWMVSADLTAAGELAAWKLAARTVEDEWRAADGGRRVNLDPGYITPLQLVLATTKTLPHAVYLRDGIYGLVELDYRRGAFHVLPWTYGDYAAAAAAGVFEPWRARLLALLKERR